MSRWRAQKLGFEYSAPAYELTALREALGLTQQEFGARLNVDKITVSRWERGAMRPSAAAVKAIDKLRRESVRKGVVIST